MNKALHVLLVLILLAASAYADPDRILTLQADGTIPEVPKQFGSVSFKVKDLGTHNPHIELHVADHKTILPRCLAQFIRTRALSDIRLGGSWDHDESGLPYYINIKFFDPNQDPHKSYNSSYDFLFNLHNAHLIHANRFDSDHVGGGHGSLIPISDHCKALFPEWK
jgi:hypothetical protein